MMASMRHRIQLTPEADEHLAKLTARDRATIVDKLERSLIHEPTVETRNRKPMRPNPIAPWELRIGRLRVYYEASEGSPPLVMVRAIGMKVRNRVRIGDQWWELSKTGESHEDPGDDRGQG
jgi:mRNA-degrading endonuclease RelE of RelBE toxin-antitoxin system